jgi:glutathione S-transferase
VIRLLGRQTSGNVQKVIFCLEELGVPYRREDYGRQFGNTLTDEYRKLNPNAKVPTLIDGDLAIWESHTILRYLAAVHRPALTGATAGERTMVERWMDWLLASLNTPYVAVFKDAKKPAAERASDFSAQAADLAAQLKTLEGHVTGRAWFALDRLTLADIALAPIVTRSRVSGRAAFAARAQALAGRGRGAPGLCRRDRGQAERAHAGGIRPGKRGGPRAISRLSTHRRRASRHLPRIQAQGRCGMGCGRARRERTHTGP